MTAAAATWEIICDQGKTLTRMFRYGTKCSGVVTPFDNTGWSARMQIRKDFSATAVVSISSVGGEIVLGGSNGEVTFTVDAETMEDLIGKYVFDIELFRMVGPVEEVVCPARGTIQVRPEVTK